MRIPAPYLLAGFAAAFALLPATALARDSDKARAFIEAMAVSRQAPVTCAGYAIEKHKLKHLMRDAKLEHEDDGWIDEQLAIATAKLAYLSDAVGKNQWCKTIWSLYGPDGERVLRGLTIEEMNRW